MMLNWHKIKNHSNNKIKLNKLRKLTQIAPFYKINLAVVVVH